MAHQKTHHSKIPYSHAKQHVGSHASSQSLKHQNPDHGPAMHEGMHHFDKGYVSDNEEFSPMKSYPDDHQRGNQYMKFQNEIVNRDSHKLNGDKFSKIA